MQAELAVLKNEVRELCPASVDSVAVLKFGTRKLEMTVSLPFDIFLDIVFGLFWLAVHLGSFFPHQVHDLDMLVL